jgi:hypothetical protein
MKNTFNFFHVLAVAILTVGAIAGTAVLSGFAGVLQFQCGSEGCGGLYDGRPKMESPMSPDNDEIRESDES